MLFRSAACRAFLESHPALRADLDGAAFTRVPGDPAAEAAHFRDWWLAWPLSRWMDEQAGERWFRREGDRFVAAFACPPELHPPLETLTGELVDYRLAQYTRSRLGDRAPALASGGAAGFRARVKHADGRPILFVPTVEEVPGRPTGPTPVVLPDGTERVFRFVKIACNVAHDPRTGGRPENVLPGILRGWFGADAGLPGTGFEVEFTFDGAVWHAAPVSLRGAAASGGGTARANARDPHHAEIGRAHV